MRSQGLKSLFLLLGWLSLSCTDGSAVQSPTDSPSIYRKALYSEVLTFDPTQMNDTASLAVGNQIYDGLLELDQHMELQPALAETWETSSDGTRLTFQLRQNVVFHNGQKLSSIDCVRSFERLLSKKSKVSQFYDLIVGAHEFREGKTNTVQGLLAPAPDKFIIILKNRFPPFPTVLAGSTAKILPSGSVDSPTFFDNPVGTGAFQVKEYGKKKIILKRFGSYWREKAKVDEMHWLVLNEQEGFDYAQRGEIHDLSTFPLNGDEPVFKSGNKVQIPIIATWLVGINTRMAPFKSRKMRHAFKSVISGASFAEQFYPGQITANGYIPKGLPGYLEQPPKIQLQNSLKSPNTIELFIPELLSKAKEIKTYFEAEFAKHGFKVKGRLVPWPEFMKGYTKKSMQAFLFSMNADYPDSEFLVRNFESSNIDNFSGLKSKKVDSLIWKARLTDSRIERAGIYRNLAEELEREAVAINLFHYKANYWVSKCVKGFEPNSLAEVYIPYRKVYLQGECI